MKNTCQNAMPYFNVTGTYHKAATPKLTNAGNTHLRQSRRTNHKVGSNNTGATKPLANNDSPNSTPAIHRHPSNIESNPAVNVAAKSKSVTATWLNANQNTDVANIAVATPAVSSDANNRFNAK